MAAPITTAPQLLGRSEFDAGELWRRHPPRFHHSKKRVVFEAAGGLSRRPRGSLGVARYAPGPLPTSFASGELSVRSVCAPFDYAAPAAGVTSWHVNFADPQLFFAYGSAAFAQDEIQVAEHPILGSLREALCVEALPGLSPLTEESGVPTPMLFKGVERWCAIDLDPDLAMPYGIYGRRFAKASDEALRQAVTRVETEHFSRLIAMAAPTGSGRYSRAHVELILLTALTAFGAARVESPPAESLVVHTGHWGTGAFGGNRILMALLQLLAARLARVDVLVYHSMDGDGSEALEEARRIAPALSEGSVADAVSRIQAMRFEWGSSDGN